MSKAIKCLNCNKYIAETGSYIPLNNIKDTSKIEFCKCSIPYIASVRWIESDKQKIKGVKGGI